MAEVIRDYLDQVQIGQVVEITVWNGAQDKPLYAATGRLQFFCVQDENYAAMFEGDGEAVIRWTEDRTFTVRYDPDRRS